MEANIISLRALDRTPRQPVQLDLFSIGVLRMWRDVAGIDQVLFGTDFPYLRRDLAVNAIRGILESSELNHLEKLGILGAMQNAFSRV